MLCKVLRYVNDHIYLLLVQHVKGLRLLSLLAGPIYAGILYTVLLQVLGCTAGSKEVVPL